MTTLVAARDGKIIFTIPAEIKADGTIWCQGNPLLGITDPVAKAKAVDAVKTKKFKEIPQEYFTRLGDNPNGLWTGTREDWAKTPAGQAEKAVTQAKAEQTKKMVSIYLSSRGWGDYSSLDWYGDITKPDAEILAECRKALETGHDVDKPNQTDEQLLDLIKTARDKWEGAPARKAAAEKAYQEDIQRKIASGFCFACETWCHGDCGNYSNDPRLQLRRELKIAQAEENYGISEGA